MFDAIERMKCRQITIVIITHRMGILPVTDKIAVMRDGMVSAFGDSEKIFDAFLRVPAKTGP